jgi:predicted nucleic acid-binding protein
VTKGIDTTFLVQLELREVDGHEQALRFLEQGLAEGHTLGIAPQVLEEFIHVSTDPRRFERPLSMTEALDKADLWWRASEVQQVLPSADARASSRKETHPRHPPCRHLRYSRDFGDRDERP